MIKQRKLQLLLLSLFILGNNCYGQVLSMDKILGEWRGVIVSSQKKIKEQTHFLVAIQPDFGCVFTMAAADSGKWSFYKKNELKITFDISGMDRIVISEIVFTGDTLYGKLNFYDKDDKIEEVSGFETKIMLVKSKSPELIKSLTDSIDFAPLVLNKKCRKILRDYKITKRISISENESYKTVFVTQFLYDFLNSYYDLADAFEINDAGGVFFITRDLIMNVPVFSKVQPKTPTRKSLDSLLSRVFTSKDQFIIIHNYAIDGGGGISAVNFKEWMNLNPIYIANQKINYDKLWMDIVNELNTSSTFVTDSISSDPKKGNYRIKSKWRYMGSDDEGYNYFEKTVVQVNKPQNGETAVKITVDSDVAKRKGYSSTVKNVGCIVPVDKKEQSFACSEQPVLKRILKKISK